MPVFRSIVFSAVLAGLIVGVVISVAQFFGTVPLIQQSEVYERKAAAESPPDAHALAGTANDHDKSHGHASEWEPEEGFQRNALTIAANILTAIGFGLLLTGAYAIRRHAFRGGRDWLGISRVYRVHGSTWPRPAAGIAGYAGSRPYSEANLVDSHGGRNGRGLWLLTFRSTASAALFGLGLIALPHLIGAPIAPNPIATSRRRFRTGLSWW